MPRMFVKPDNDKNNPRKFFLAMTSISFLAIFLAGILLIQGLVTFAQVSNEKDELKALITNPVFFGITLSLYFLLQSFSLHPRLYFHLRTNLELWIYFILLLQLCFLGSFCFIIADLSQETNIYIFSFLLSFFIFLSFMGVFLYLPTPLSKIGKEALNNEILWKRLIVCIFSPVLVWLVLSISYTKLSGTMFAIIAIFCTGLSWACLNIVQHLLTGKHPFFKYPKEEESFMMVYLLFVELTGLFNPGIIVALYLISYYSRDTKYKFFSAGNKEYQFEETLYYEDQFYYSKKTWIILTQEEYCINRKKYEETPDLNFLIRSQVKEENLELEKGNFQEEK